MSGGTVLWGPVQLDRFLDANQFSRVTPWLPAPMRGYAECGVVLFAVIAWLSYVILACRLSRLVDVAANTPVRPLLVADGADR